MLVYYVYAHIYIYISPFHRVQAEMALVVTHCARGCLIYHGYSERGDVQQQHTSAHLHTGKMAVSKAAQ